MTTFATAPKPRIRSQWKMKRPDNALHTRASLQRRMPQPSGQRCSWQSFRSLFHISIILCVSFDSCRLGFSISLCLRSMIEATVASQRLKASSPRGHYVRLLIPTQQHTTQGQVHCGIEALEELERLIHAKELVALLDKRPQGLTATQNSAKSAHGPAAFKPVSLQADSSV